MATSVLAYGCTKPAEPNPDDAPPTEALLNVLIVSSDANLLWSGSHKFGLGTNCLDAMKQMVPTQTKDTAFGPLVTSIKGVSAPNGYYWSLYIDNKYATVGINDCKLYSNKLVMWKLEKIEAMPPSR
ncbi:MAG: DUF4430 domain-containing protein [Candidatus Diapherotrites archaeon]|nr:DUF4430 domain-containing protein [Candidatus Diapherotrites archaeon]